MSADGPAGRLVPPEWIAEHGYTDEQIERFKAEWERQQHGYPGLLTPLPRRVRFRLRRERLWRAFGMWRR